MVHNCTIDLTEITNNSNKKLKNNKTAPRNDPSKNSKSKNIHRKNTILVGDSILKQVEGWRLIKRMKSTVSVRSIPGTSTNGMAHDTK